MCSTREIHFSTFEAIGLILDAIDDEKWKMGDLEDFHLKYGKKNLGFEGFEFIDFISFFLDFLLLIFLISAKFFIKYAYKLSFEANFILSDGIADRNSVFIRILLT